VVYFVDRQLEPAYGRTANTYAPSAFRAVGPDCIRHSGRNNILVRLRASQGG
jgi:hypothetical protein